MPRPKQIIDLSQPYEIPSELMEDDSNIGLRFKHCLIRNYGGKGFIGPLSEYFDVGRATLSGYLKSGVPHDRRGELKKFINNSGFKMPKNARLKHFLRKPLEKKQLPTDVVNIDLLTFLDDCTKCDDFTSQSLKLACNYMPATITAPHLFYKWAYSTGGIPATYVEGFIAGMIDANAHKVVLGMDPEVFADFVRNTMASSTTNLRN